MPVLNSRWTTEGPRRMPSSVPQLTSTAPTGPHSTTAASDAMVLADHASPRAFSKVAEDSQATKSRPSTAIWLQSSPAYGPLASTITAAAITAPIYSHAMRESLSTLPPRSHPPSTRIAPIAVATPRRPRMSSLGQSSLARKCQRPPTLYRRCQDNVATLISADLKPDHRRPVSGRYVRGGLFGYFDLGLDLLDTHQNLAAQLARHRVAPAVLGDEPFHRFLKAVLAQTGPALVEVLPDVVAVVFRYLAIEIPVHQVEYLVTRRLVGLSAAHCPPSSAFARTRPCSAA